jgi:hypothetical protein
MKIAKPISFAPRSHKDDGFGLWRDEYFDKDLRHEIKRMAKQDIPVSMRGEKLFYNNKVEGVRFHSIIADLGQANQWRQGWVNDAFVAQIGVERLLRALSVLPVEELVQQERGEITWRWVSRSFRGYLNSESQILLQISDGEICRTDRFDLCGPLIPGFVLECMQRIERALSVQIKLKLHLEKKGIVVKPIPNHLVAAPCVIIIPLAGPLRYKMDGQDNDATTIQIHSYISEFEAPPSAPDLPTVSEMITSLNLV